MALPRQHTARRPSRAPSPRTRPSCARPTRARRARVLLPRGHARDPHGRPVGRRHGRRAGLARRRRLARRARAALEEAAASSPARGAGSGGAHASWRGSDPRTLALALASGPAFARLLRSRARRRRAGFLRLRHGGVARAERRVSVRHVPRALARPAPRPAARPNASRPAAAGANATATAGTVVPAARPGRRRRRGLAVTPRSARRKVARRRPSWSSPRPPRPAPARPQPPPSSPPTPTRGMIRAEAHSALYLRPVLIGRSARLADSAGRENGRRSVATRGRGGCGRRDARCRPAPQPRRRRRRQTTLAGGRHEHDEQQDRSAVMADGCS